MTFHPSLLAVATYNDGADTIFVDVAQGLSHGHTVTVKTTSPVTLLKPPGWPSRPSHGGQADFPGNVILAGESVTLLETESRAWLAAGVAKLPSIATPPRWREDVIGQGVRLSETFDADA